MEGCGQESCGRLQTWVKAAARKMQLRRQEKCPTGEGWEPLVFEDRWAASEILLDLLG